MPPLTRHVKQEKIKLTRLTLDAVPIHAGKSLWWECVYLLAKRSGWRYMDYWFKTDGFPYQVWVKDFTVRGTMALEPWETKPQSLPYQVVN